jgi:uncharacterized protein (DUF58 family)
VRFDVIGGEDVHVVLLNSDAVWTGRSIPPFRWNILSPSSGLKMESTRRHSPEEQPQISLKITVAPVRTFMVGVNCHHSILDPLNLFDSRSVKSIEITLKVENDKAIGHKIIPNLW